MDENAPPVQGPLERHPDDLPPEPGVRRGIPRGLLWALALAVVVLTIASWVALGAERAAPPARDPSVVRLDANPPSVGLLPNVDVVGKPAPTTVLEDFATGTTASLADLRGTPVVVNFWATTCTPCLTEMPAFEQVHQRYAGRVQFVGVNSNDPQPDGAAREMARRLGVTYRLTFDRTDRLITELGGIALPTTAFIDRNGTVVYSHSGERSAAQLADAIEQHLKP